MADKFDFEWNQGEDYTLSLIYKSGPTGSEIPVDLTLYSLRMDIIGPDGKILSILNDEQILDTDPNTAGNQTDTVPYEVTMGNAGQITIVLARALTLVGGPFYRYINSNPSSLVFSYDIFLRDSTNKQRKIMYGDITVVKSVTKWA